MTTLSIPQQHGNPTLDLALHTVGIKKQALVFVNTKRSAEKEAEEIAKKIKSSTPELEAISEEVLNILDRPTKQCERLARCVKKGIAFHHAGLHSRQKEMIEDAFRAGTIKVICCTPTLAFGLDLPAFRAIIRDVKRYGHHGLDFIPVLEYLQMAGRAGRPSFDRWGEAIVVADTLPEKEEIEETYIHGDPESILSKLAVEPVLRTYLLTLISTRIVASREDIHLFFSKTFWAHQFKDVKKLGHTIDRMLGMLEEWQFVESSQKSGFVAATEIEKDSYAPTPLGKRVAELYLDPLTAHQFVVALERIKEKVWTFALLQLVSHTLEMRPLLKAGTREYDVLQKAVVASAGQLLEPEPSLFDEDYGEFIDSIKTAKLLSDWMEECDDEQLLETYKVRPGETRAKLERADWLLYALHELSGLLKKQSVLKDIAKARYRLRYGVKEELLPLLQLEGIGRIRARKMFNNGIKTLEAVRNADLLTLGHLIGQKMAENVKKQLGETIPEKISERKRKGQMNLGKYGGE